MPGVTTPSIRARPAYLRHLLLSNRIQCRNASWKTWFSEDNATKKQESDVKEERHSKWKDWLSEADAAYEQKYGKSSVPQAKIEEETTVRRDHGDPIPRTEDLLKTIDQKDMLKAVIQGPSWLNTAVQPHQRIDSEPFGRGKKKRSVHSIDTQERHIKRKIKQLEAELHFDKGDEHFNKMTYADLPPAAKEGFLETVGMTKEQIEGVNVLMPVPDEHRAVLVGLNDRLSKADKSPRDRNHRRELWKYYCRCKWRIPGFLNHISDTTWSLLWKVEDISRNNPNRVEHLGTYAEDMESVGKKASPEQSRARLESEFKAGDVDSAIWEWESWYSEITNAGKLPAPEEMELGIRMHCKAGGLERAGELLNEYFAKYPRPNARLALPIIDALSKSAQANDLRDAVILYLKMKEILGDKITMDDYDRVSLSFFRALKPDLSLMVFMDLMNSPSSPFKGPDLDTEASRRILDLQLSSQTPQRVNRASLSALTVLPRRLQNKFFFGAWLKKLIGLGQLDAAAQVIELMFERGITPASMHINGLSNALYLTNNEGDKARADQMIRAMIQQRQNAVDQRQALRKVNPQAAEDFNYHTLGFTQDEWKLPKFLRRNIPAATTETFVVLARYYRNIGKPLLVRELPQIMKSLELPSNTVFLEQFLYARMSTMTEKSLNRPMFKQFAFSSALFTPSVLCYDVIWKSMMYRLEQTRHKLGHIDSRDVFAHMAQWWSSTSEEQKARETVHWDKTRYNRILSIFLRNRDLHGAMVAMHALKKLFGLYPDGLTVKEMGRALALLSFKQPNTASQRLRIQMSKSYDENVQATYVVLQALFEELTKEEFVPRIKDGNIPDDQYGDREQLLKLLTQLLWVFIARNQQVDMLKMQIWIAKNNMGLDHLHIGSMGDYEID